MTPEERHWAKDLFLAFHCGHDHFDAYLFKLINKGVGHNRVKLAVCYPIAVALYEEWHSTPREKDFFIKYNIGVFLFEDSRERKIYERMFSVPRSDGHAGADPTRD